MALCVPTCSHPFFLTPAPLDLFPWVSPSVFTLLLPHPQHHRVVTWVIPQGGHPADLTLPSTCTQTSSKKADPQIQPKRPSAFLPWASFPHEIQDPNYHSFSIFPAFSLSDQMHPCTCMPAFPFQHQIGTV